jgi:dihydrofolate reductase
MEMIKKNCAFIATSLDGYIADKNGEIGWLNTIPNPDQLDMGYNEFSSGIDAILMGRNTFDTVCGFEMAWPYVKPVFVLSNSLTEIPEKAGPQVSIVKGALPGILEEINRKGFHKLYIDGGIVIQNFLKEDLLDEITISVLPVILGGGCPLFSYLPKMLEFQLLNSKTYLNSIVQNHYVRQRGG